jgi:hypothetical protein
MEDAAFESGPTDPEDNEPPSGPLKLRKGNYVTTRARRRSGPAPSRWSRKSRVRSGISWVLALLNLPAWDYRPHPGMAVLPLRSGASGST